MRRIYPVAMAGFLTVAAVAPAQARVQAVIVQWGEIEVGEPAGPLGPEYDEHSLSRGQAVASSRYINHDDHLAAQLCRAFGFRAWLTHGPGETLPHRILLRVNHPTLTRPDGATGSQDTLMLPVVNGATGTSFGFDEVWEAVPGTWTFELVLGGDVIASKDFVVTRPQPGDPAPTCPGRAVS